MEEINYYCWLCPCRTVKFWDLETLQFIASTEPESSSIRCIKFHPDGSPLFSGGQDSLRVSCIKGLSVLVKFDYQIMPGLWLGTNLLLRCYSNPMGKSS